MAHYGPKSYNLDINQLGTSNFPRFSILQDAPYKDGLVEDIITDEKHPQYDKELGMNIGMVQVRIIPDDRGVPKDKLNWAMPLESAFREYPLKNEMVMLFFSVGRLFYTRRINITNKITENSWPGLSDAFSAKTSKQKTAENMALAAKGGPSYRPWNSTQSTELGDEFAENPNVRMVRPMQGDTIIQGRYGNIIRFGSSVFSNPVTPTPQANLLITVGQTNRGSVVSTDTPSIYSLVYEDINKDRNCVWIVTDETVDLDPATIDVSAHLRSSEYSRADKYTGAGIFVNSDRLILNSKLNEISLFSKKEINLSAVQSITIDSAKSVQMTATKDVKVQAENDVLIKGKTLSFVSTGAAPMGDISFTAAENYIISGKRIFIGKYSNNPQPLVLGGELALWLQNLLQVLSVDLARAFTTLDPVTYSRKVTKLLEQLGSPTSPQSAVFNSTSNFTSKTN